MQGHYNTGDKLPGQAAREEAWPGSKDMGENKLNVAERLSKCKDLNEIDESWQSYAVKNELHEEYYKWLSELRNWVNFISLTFRDEKPPDVAFCFYRRLVQILNKRLYGNNYTRKVGHSYFNYVIGMEFKLSREVCHFHVLVDKSVDFDLLHTWWNAAAGWAWVDQIKDKEKALHYVTKYVCKGGDQNINWFLSAKDKLPAKIPVWWKDIGM